MAPECIVHYRRHTSLNATYRDTTCAATKIVFYCDGKTRLQRRWLGYLIMAEQSPPDGFGDIPETAFAALRDIVLDSYDKAALKQTVQKVFNRNFDNEVANVPFSDQVYELLEKFDQQGLLDKLLHALIEGRPDKPRFEKELREAIAAAPTADPGPSGPPPKPKTNWSKLTLFGFSLVLAGGAFAAGLYGPKLFDPDELVVRVYNASSDPLPSVNLAYYSAKADVLQIAAKQRSEHHIPLNEIEAGTQISFAPAVGPAEQNQSRCIEKCYKILKMYYSDPRTLYLYLEEVSDDDGGQGGRNR
jgi:hypothetical protein